jgi:hypothetical protein
MRNDKTNGGRRETAWQDDCSTLLPCDAGEVGPDGRVHDYTFAACIECEAEAIDDPLVAGWMRQAAAEARRRGLLTREDAIAAGFDSVTFGPAPAAPSRN